MKTTYRFQGIILELDDADSDAPATVWSSDRRYCSSYDAATAIGVLESTRTNAPFELTTAQSEWLASPGNEQRVASAYDKARAGNPQYQ